MNYELRIMSFLTAKTQRAQRLFLSSRSLRLGGKIFLLVLWALMLVGCGGTAVSTQPADASLVSLLSEEDPGAYEMALLPDNIEFPRDLGEHPGYQTEWWYYTGIVATENGRQFGYQFTIFRRALTPLSEFEETLATLDETSEWRTNQLYLAHFTISDIANSDFYKAERFSRGSLGLAGAQAVPYRVWLEDWSVYESGPESVRITAQTEEMALDVTLRQTIPPVLHGDGGLSQKGPERGNASYYYSIVQQTTEGTVTLQGEQFAVSGLSWKDHEYSTNALSPGAIGWDWFSLQFDNGTALMLFQIRNEDGSVEPFSNGSFIDADGRVTPISYEQWELTVLDTWTSPQSGATYPAGWRLTIPELGLDLTGQPLMPNQELAVSTVYWEGAVAFEGVVGDSAVRAQGYVELTGYAGSMEGRL
jgi:predicted secreted hydrolase